MDKKGIFGECQCDSHHTLWSCFEGLSPYLDEKQKKLYNHMMLESLWITGNEVLRFPFPLFPVILYQNKSPLIFLMTLLLVCTGSFWPLKDWCYDYIVMDRRGIFGESGTHQRLWSCFEGPSPLSCKRSYISIFCYSSHATVLLRFDRSVGSSGRLAADPESTFLLSVLSSVLRNRDSL